MDDIEAIIDETDPAAASVLVCIKGGLLAEYDELQEQLEQAADWKPSSLSDEDPRTVIRARLSELRSEMQAHMRRFTFRTLGGKESSDLLLAHPSPKNEQGEEEYAWNPQTYPAALVAASSVSPKMSVTQAERLFDKLNLAQRNKIFGAAYRANNRDVDVPFSEASSEPEAGTA